ncbi:head-tail adaptor protein [Paenibacillus sp. 7124]|uniref:Head-tail adaptor protein n=1 Tax=Paenibacillus apii TaxID=1850370 RepID=A0A6M1PLS2_9BACL|nr:head-tail adaptor protein [Paenibacillus apii]NGM81291.1 head-tail adaptor protein [Paenibacillus apii]
MEAGKLRNKLEVWKNELVIGELKAKQKKPVKVKEIWAQIIPQTGSIGRREGIETILTNCTNKLIVRYNSGKDITSDMWFKYRGNRFDILYILNPYFANESLEIFLSESVG